MDRGTYVYCLIADAKPPSLRGVRKGLPGTGPVRLLPVPAARKGPARYLVVADAPLDRYGEAAINGRLSNLDWVSRAAIAHESVVESFSRSAATLPMKLFTIFRSDDRALAHVLANQSHIEAVLATVTGHDEWGVRVALDLIRARRLAQGRGAAAGRAKRSSGAGYLAGKKAQRDVAKELAGRSREVVAELLDRLAREARVARRRTASELPIQGGPLLLDASLLVSRRRAKGFRAGVERQARMLSRLGYVVSLTGPWPPYSFMQG